MESPGVYWKPVCSLLEEAFTGLRVNAAPSKQRSRGGRQRSKPAPGSRNCWRAGSCWGAACRLSRSGT
jgi:hypothetical protein